MSATAGSTMSASTMGDALEVIERLPDASLERVYLLHPDPWPKARQPRGG